MPGSRLRWNEWITFHVKYCDLSPDASVTFSLVGSKGARRVQTIGSARLPLFNDARQLRTGIVKVMFDLESTAIDPLVAPQLAAAAGGATGMAAHEIAQLEELAARHEAATAHPDAALDWLNRPTNDHLEHRLQARSGVTSLQHPSSRSQAHFVETRVVCVAWMRRT